MGRILAIDYGRKRVGLAVTDPLQLIATGIRTVAAHEVLSFLEEYLGKEQVDLLVVGLPKQSDGTASESMAYIAPFMVALKHKFPAIPIEMYDERFTSVMAHKALIEGGFKRKIRQDKSVIDTISATIILNSFLESRLYATKYKPDL